MQSVNNEFAVGFDNMIKRGEANTPGENFNAAHDSVFDKLLSDYFLSKRGEYKDSNNLVNELATIFEDKTVRARKGTSMDHLHREKLANEINKEAEPVLAAENFRDMISLDVLTQRAMQKSKNGLS